MNIMIAKKIGMSRRFREDGTVVPVTVLQAGPCTVTQVKSTEPDGYSAVQMGFGTSRRVHKPQQSAGQFATVVEFRLPSTEGLAVGTIVNAAAFTAGELLKVTATSKGKGFQGVVKRHHFRGGPASHGHKDNLRAPGSIGATFPQHVMKGTRMAGRMGGDRVSVGNLEVIDVVPEQHLVLVKGAVPGPRNGIVLLETVR